MKTLIATLTRRLQLALLGQLGRLLLGTPALRPAPVRSRQAGNPRIINGQCRRLPDTPW